MADDRDHLHQVVLGPLRGRAVDEGLGVRYGLEVPLPAGCVLHRRLYSLAQAPACPPRARARLSGSAWPPAAPDSPEPVLSTSPSYTISRSMPFWLTATRVTFAVPSESFSASSSTRSEEHTSELQSRGHLV